MSVVYTVTRRDSSVGFTLSWFHAASMIPAVRHMCVRHNACTAYACAAAMLPRAHWCPAGTRSVLHAPCSKGIAVTQTWSHHVCWTWTPKTPSVKYVYYEAL